jgi:hypothetical protein
VKVKKRKEKKRKEEWERSQIEDYSEKIIREETQGTEWS